jgi:hypothetical protein
VLFSAERLPVLEVARRADASRPAVWRWQRRYGEQGVDGLLRDKTRKPGKAPLSAKVVAKVLWLNAVEGFFSTITRRKIRPGVFKSVADLEGAISRYIKAHNKTSKPFEWTAPRLRSSKSSRKPLNLPNESVHSEHGGSELRNIEHPHPSLEGHYPEHPKVGLGVCPIRFVRIIPMPQRRWVHVLLAA